MATTPILIVGATGTIGTELVQKLVNGGRRVRALSRDPKKAVERLGSNVEVARGDLADPSSLAVALEGVEVASLATSPSPVLFEQEKNFIEAAKTARLRRVVKLSAFGHDFARDAIHLGHAKSEALLRASGIPFVFVRPVIFMSNMFMDLASIKSGKLPSVFEDAPMSFVDPRDVAEVMMRALVEDRHDGSIWEFGGPEPLTYDQLAATFTRILGRRVEHVRVDVPTFRESALRDGLPDFVVEAITEAAKDTREGRFATNDDVVHRILGRRASSFADWVKRHRDAFTS